MAKNQPELKDLGLKIRDFYERFRRRNPVEPDSFGLELEMEGLDGINLGDFTIDFGNTQGWSVHEDGSLRNGVEFVSNGPRLFSDLPGDLDRLNRKIDKRAMFKPNFSLRTSVHVHMNVQHLTWLEVINIFVLYLMYEQALIEFGGEERNGNVHCLSGLDAQSNVEYFRRALVADIEPDNDYTRNYGRNTFRSVSQAIVDRGRRYAALNFAALPQHGTLEFRTHRGTRDTAEIMEWVTIIRSLRDAAVAYNNPQQIVADFSTRGHVRLAAEMWRAHPRLMEIIGRQRNQCWQGMRLAQEIAFSRSNWSTTKAEKQQPKGVPEPTQWVVMDDLRVPGGGGAVPAEPEAQQRVEDRRQELIDMIVREHRRLGIQRNVN